MDPAEFKSEFRVICGGQGSPQASLVLPVYRSRFAGQALASVLAQRDVILEILVSDDASGDGTPQRLLHQLDAYRGPHRVVFRQGRRRLGLDHFTCLADAASCEITLMAHHDDIALPERARRVLDTFAATGADVVSSAYTLIDAGGQALADQPPAAPGRFIPLQQMLGPIWLPEMLGAGLAWRRSVFVNLPHLTSRYLSGGHDALICFRGALQGGFYSLGEALFQRRSHAEQWGKRLYDHRSRLIDDEGVAARLLGIAVAMQKDIHHLCQQPAGASLQPVADLESLAIQTVARQAARLYELRAGLALEGKRMLWVDERQFEAILQPPLLRRLANREPFWSIKAWIKKYLRK